jgi:spore coat polysaccharide biosynthesis predicted glycosyltransferase SpsG
MNILFRVDAGGKTGLGHYFRSMTLAKLLAADNHTIIFTHQPSSFWENANTPFLNYPLTEDADEKTVDIVKKHSISVFYVDGIIEFSRSLVSELNRLGVKLIYYQNISETKHLCDAFILPSLNYDEQFLADFGTETEVFKGLEYAIFHEQIYRIPRNKQVSQFVKKVGFFSGGSDPKNVLLKLYHLIEHDAFSGISFNYFYGKDYLFINDIPPLKDNDQVRFVPYNIDQVSKMDVLVGTFGVSAYEYMYVGVPLICVGHQISNARASAKTAEKTGAIIDLGVIDDISSSDLNQAISDLIKHKQKRESLRKNAHKAIDALGAERVKKIITS